MKLHSYFTSYIVVLPVMPDPEMPKFLGEMVFCSSVLLATAIQSAARGMTRRILAWFWNTKLETSEYRLIPRAIFETEDVMATQSAIAQAPCHVQGESQLLTATTGSYLYHVDCLLKNMERESYILQGEFTACAQHSQALREEVQKATRVARAARKDQSALAKKLNEETTWRITAEIKFAQAETELAKLRAHQVEMECKEEAHLAAMELVQDKAESTLKTWMESDSIQVDEIQELLDMLPEEYQPAIRKVDFSLVPTEPQVKECMLEDLPLPVEAEEWRTATTADFIPPEDHLEESQMVQPQKKPRCSED